MPAADVYPLPAGCAQPLIDAYDAFLVDLDGVVHVGDHAVSGAAETLAAVRDRGLPVRYLTNNASRPRADVVEVLAGFGIAATEADVVTSAIVTAAVVADDLPGARVLVVGGAGLREAAVHAGLTPVATAADGPTTVLQGWGPDVCWRDLAEGCVALRGGARWVVTNLDATLPSPRGPLPGSGALVAALRAALGREPDLVVGKPSPLMYAAARQGLSATRPLAIGDRLDTDIAGAHAAGLDALCVLSGVTDVGHLLAATPECRPTYVGADLRALLEAHPPVQATATGARCRGSAATTEGTVTGIDVDAVRAAAALTWAGGVSTAAIAALAAALGRG